MSSMFFDGWASIARTLIAGSLGYIALIGVLRVCGKRTLSKWNAFDYVVTIALGSTLATLVLSKTTTLAQGLAALFLLVALQFIVTWLSVRFRPVSNLVKARPALLLYRGQLQPEAMRSSRVTEGEIRAALRMQGLGSVAQAGAVVLETDGSFSVIRDIDESGDSTLTDVRGFSGQTGR
ncbi:MAG: YetF domain-containing protein [Spartobacteria bacterium]